MNRAQKNAWFGLVNCVLAIIFCGFFFYRGFFYLPKPGFRFDPTPSQIEIILKNILLLWPLALPVIALILLLVPRKKQSPYEPDFDEMDNAIRNKAIRVSFISVWFLWPLTLILAMLGTGVTTNLPVVWSFFIYLAVFLICMSLHFLTMVFLYRKQTERDDG
jgi:hypothetical protein